MHRTKPTALRSPDNASAAAADLPNWDLGDLYPAPDSAELEADLPSPDLIIFLSANKKVLRQRMKAVGHPKLIVDGLTEQVRLYDEWISCRSESVVKIDNSKCPPAMLDAILKGWLC